VATSRGGRGPVMMVLMPAVLDALVDYLNENKLNVNIAKEKKKKDAPKADASRALAAISLSYPLYSLVLG
jgi:hypothetical protein